MVTADATAIPNSDCRDIVIVDPVCAKRSGHNLPTLSKYADFFGDYGHRIAAIHVASTFAEPPSGCTTDLTFNYAPFFDPEVPSRVHAREKRIARGFGPVVIREATKFFLCYPILHHRAVTAAVRDLERLLARYPNATLFFPGADFYVIWAVRMLASAGALRKRKLSLRLMGVMETAGFMPVPERVLPQLIRDIVCAAAGSVTLTAETEKYARRVESWSQVHVPVTLIPAFRRDLLRAPHARRPSRSISPANPLVLGFLGGARADKGYSDLPEIAHRLYAKFGLTVRCYVQTMLPSERYYSRSENDSLARWPNVHLLPALLDEEQMVRTIRQCDALVLPYSTGTYEWRGSAMLFDALSMGIPAIGRRGTAFGESIDSFSLGCTFHDVEDLVIHVGALAKAADDVRIRDNWHLAGKNYLLTLEAALNRSVTTNEEVMYLH